MNNNYNIITKKEFILYMRYPRFKIETAMIKISSLHYYETIRLEFCHTVTDIDYTRHNKFNFESFLKGSIKKW